MPPTNSAVILEWAFAPADYFAAPIRVKRDAYVIALGDGKVEVRVDAALYSIEPTLREQLHETVNGWFAEAQRASGRPYRLTGPSELRVYYDATRGEVETPPPSLSSTPPSAAPAPTPRGGAAETRGAGLAAKHRVRDPLLRSLLQTYDAAIADPGQELARLGAIRDALAARLGDPPGALGVDAREWAWLGELASGTPPDAGVGARAHARAIVLRAILAYLRRPEGGAPALSAD